MSSPNQPPAGKEKRDLFFQFFEFAPDAMLVVDAEGTIQQANARTEQAFGYPRSELIGKSVDTLVPDRFASHRASLREDFSKSAGERTIAGGAEAYPLVGLRKDGTEFPVEIVLGPAATSDGQLTVAVVREVVDRRKIQRLTDELERSETHLKEVHHRVKNNLQIISSLLYLRSVQSANPQVTRVLKECQARVRSIGLLHEKLHGSTVFAKLNLAEYLRDFIVDLIRTYEVPGRPIEVKTDFESTHLGGDAVVPCALIVHELVSNAFLHAFPNEMKGEVRVELCVEDGWHVLTVQDNGVGMPDLQQASGSLGLSLVRDLTKQLRGQLQIEVGNGTRARVLFKKSNFPA